MLVLLLPFVHRENESQPCAKPRLKHEWASWMSRQGRPTTRVLVWASELRPERKLSLMSWVELRQDSVDPIPRPHGQESQLSAGSALCHALALPEDTCLPPRHRGRPDTGMDCVIRFYTRRQHMQQFWHLTASRDGEWGIRPCHWISAPTLGTEGYPYSGYILRGPGYQRSACDPAGEWNAPWERAVVKKRPRPGNQRKLSRESLGMSFTTGETPRNSWPGVDECNKKVW